jgi:hypothetical protein
MPPPRTLVTIAVALIIAVLIVWVVTRLPWARDLGGTGRRRTLLAAVLAAVLAAFLTWLLVIFPAYWD